MLSIVKILLSILVELTSISITKFSLIFFTKFNKNSLLSPISFISSINIYFKNFIKLSRVGFNSTLTFNKL